MALVIADRVRDSTTTTGTGTVTLSGVAPTGYQAFSVIGDGNTTFYTIHGGSQWETGIGTYTSAGTTLARTTVLASSNSGNAVDFSAGTKSVFCDLPSGRTVYTGGPLGTPSSGTVTNLTGTASININGTVGATTPSTGAFTTFSGYAAASSLQITGVIRNDNAGSPTAALGLNVSASGAGDTSVSKAGIGLTRTNAQGVGTLALYNRTSTDTSSFTTSDAVLSFNGNASNAATMTPALTVTGGINSTNIGATTPGTGAFTTITSTGLTDSAGSIRAQGTTVPASGSGIELHLNGGTGLLYPYDRTGGAYMPLSIQGTQVEIAPNGAQKFLVTSTGINATNIGGTTPGTAAFTTFSGYAAASSLQITGVIRNDNAGSPTAALGLNVSASGAGDTSVSKAGIGLTRTNAQGVGTLALYNRTSTDTSSFTTSDAVLSFNGNASNAATMTPALTVTGGINSTNIGATTPGTGAFTTITSTGLTDSAGSIRAQGTTVPASGSGIELHLNGGTGFIYPYNRTGSVYLPMSVQGSQIEIAPSGTTKFIVTAAGAGVTGLLDLSNAASGQIQFPATQNASSNANTLDDYEEGTVTLTDGSGAGLSFSAMDVEYTKIGNKVIMGGQFSYPATGDASAAICASLPFTVANSDNVTNAGAVRNSATNATHFSVPIKNTTTFRFMVWNGNAANSTFSSAAVQFTLIYRASA